jgi:SAM-dependent methyltransferase
MSRFDPRAYWEKRLESSTGLQGVGYLGLGQPFNAWMYRVRRGVFKRVVGRHLPKMPRGRVLDVGSGTGEYLRLWRTLRATSITGSDITATAVERLAKEFLDATMVRMDIAEAQELPKGPFDAISCMDVLFHIVDDESLVEALRNIRGLLTSDGLLFLSDNFVHGAGHRQEHFVTRTLAEYEAALGKAGLRVIERRPMFHLLNRPLDSRSPLLHRWWGLVMRTCQLHPQLGGLLAAAVFPIESLLVSLRREGVSTEIMVCTPVA